MKRENAVERLVESNTISDTKGFNKSAKKETASNISIVSNDIVSTDKRIYADFKPTQEIDGFKVRPGFYDINGATAIPGGVNFTLHSNGATKCWLLLFHRKEKDPYATLLFPSDFRIGKVFSMIVFDLDIEEFEYCYRLDGPWNPEKGLLFDASHVLLDPYAKAVTGQSNWGEHKQWTGDYHARVVKNNFQWHSSSFPNTPMEDSIIYEMHVRGFTRHESSGVNYPGTFAGVIEKIPYLKKLGITAVELMPIFEFDETMDMREHDGVKLLDYWGYNTVAFFAPNTSYTASHEYNYEGNELKNMVRLLNENGIEVILDVVFNHTAEGNEKGPFISFKGFDNNIYYMLTPNGEYYNFSGCGNTVNCNHPIVQRFIVECLRYWVTEYRIDGFRFDLASILGRNEDGSPMSNPPLLERLAYDPILGNVKLIAEAWDAGGMYQVGHFPAYNRWAEWNGRYRDCVRDYLKGSYWNAQEVVSRITGSTDLYHGVYAGYTSSINFLTCHDGFTLYDLYSFNTKHNEKNGWNNTDGADDNRSWNCGVEGETNDPEIISLRFRMMRNAITALMCSRGTPMLLAGDEFGNTQFGNNNSYCQDNEISWLNWNKAKENKEYFQFYSHMIAFRKAHPVISRNLAPATNGMPSISAATTNPNDHEITQDTKTLCIMYAGYDAKKKADDVVYIALNPYWEAVEIQLPSLPEKFAWAVKVYTADVNESYYRRKPERLYRNSFLMEARSTAVFLMVSC